MRQFMSNTFNKVLGKQTNDPLTVTKNEALVADAGLIVPKKNQPGFIGRFMLSQAGGFDPKYYTKETAKEAAQLAKVKFASVTLATYAVMKAIHPIFESPSIKTLPTIGDADPKLIIMGGTAAATWLIISEIDKAVLHAVRSEKAMKKVEKDIGHKFDRSIFDKTIGRSLRYGISVGSLSISLLALGIAVSDNELTKQIQEERKGENSDIVGIYQKQFQDADTAFIELQKKRSSIIESLQNIGPAPVVTEEQTKRLAELNSLLATLEQQKIELEAQKREQEIEKNKHEKEITRQTLGLEGAQPGCATACETAKANLALALGTIASLDGAINTITTDYNAAKTQKDEIVSNIEETQKLQTQEDDKKREDLNNQLVRLDADIAAQLALRNRLEDFNAAAANDPRFIPMNPDMAEKSKAFIKYFKNDPDPMLITFLGGMALIVICAELGVFALATGKRVNNSEFNAQLAEVLKNQKSADIYKKMKGMLEIDADFGEDDALSHLRLKRQVSLIRQEYIDEALEKLKADPEFRQAALDEIDAIKKSFQPDGTETSMTTQSGVKSTVTTNPEQENGNQPSNDNVEESNIPEKKASGPQPS